MCGLYPTHGRDDATGALILSTAPNGDVQRYLADHPDAPLHTRAKWVSN